MTLPRRLPAQLFFGTKLGVPALGVLALGALALVRAPGFAQPPRLTLERLYSLPSLIGTAPGGFAWSADSRRLAFLWNDEGMPFRDVWVLDLDQAPLAPRRVTRFADTGPAMQPAPDDPLERAAHQERVERDRGVSAVVWHPDSRHLVVEHRGDLHWIDGLETNGDTIPEDLTASGERESSAAFSPDGRHLAMLRAGDVWVSPLDDRGRPGRARRLTQLGSETVRVARYDFSPGGDRILLQIADSSRVPTRSIPDYLHEEPRLVEVRRANPGEEPVRERLGVVSVDGGGPVWLAVAENETDPVWSARWSPDGHVIAVDTSDLYVKHRRVMLADPGTGRARPLFEEREPNNVTATWQIEWSPDGRALYFLSDRDDTSSGQEADVQVWRIEVATGEAKPITRGPGAVAGFEVTADALLAVTNRDRSEQRQLDRIALNDDAPGGVSPRRVSVRPGTHQPTVSPDGRWAAVLFSSDTTPPELLLTDLGTASDRGPIEGALRERRITVSPTDDFDAYRWAEPTYVTFPSQVDDAVLHGRLTLPPDLDRTKKHPAILGSVYSDTVRNQWGGRTAHPTWGLDQYLVQQGYVLLNVDIRGSWGHGRSFRQGIRLDYGGIVDEDRIGIWGSSYGGLLTTMSLFEKPGLYAAGFAGAPATNVRHALTGQMTVMMRPEDEPEAYDDSSSFTHVEGLEDPLMILHGMRDTIVLYRDTVNLVQRLISLGKDVDLVTLPDAQHGWDTEGLTQTRFAFHKLVTFFDRHLKADDPETPR